MLATGDNGWLSTSSASSSNTNPPPPAQLDDDDAPALNLSFSGCGFLCIYHAGVAAAISQYAPQLTLGKISGASAGSIIACGLVTRVCIADIANTILRVVSEARRHAVGPFHPTFNLMGLLKEGLIKSLPPDAYKTCTNRLYISLTRWKDQENVVVHEYSSNEDLMDAILCSCFIPGFCGVYTPSYRGVQYMDGGFTDNLPVRDEYTVTVSPFSGEADICPSDEDCSKLLGIVYSNTSIRLTTRNAMRLLSVIMPLTTEECSKMCLQGFEDAVKFLNREGLAPCISCLVTRTLNTGVDERQWERITQQRELRRRQQAQQQAVRRSPRTRSITALGPCAGGGINEANADLGAGDRQTCSRTRGDSECDSCGAEMLTTGGRSSSAELSRIFPPVMQETLDAAVAAERTFFSYLLSFRLVRCVNLAMGTVKLPFDVAIAVVRRLLEWTRISAFPAWLVKRFDEVARLVLEELDRHRTDFSARVSCQLSVFDAAERDEAVCSSKSYWSSSTEDLLAASNMPPPSAAALAEAAVLRRRDQMVDQRNRRRRQEDAQNANASYAGNEQSWISSSRIGWEAQCSYDADSLNRLVEAARRQDALYAFHFLGDDNTVTYCEVAAAAASGTSTSSSSDSLRPVARKNATTTTVCPSFAAAPGVAPPLSPIVEEGANSPAANTRRVAPRTTFSPPPPGGDDRDSGLSGIDERTTTGAAAAAAAAAAEAVTKRDACCSPVRALFVDTDFLPLCPSNSSSTVAAAAAPGPAQSHHSLQAIPVASSDSEDDDENSPDKLFVPNRMRRRLDSREYEGEAELSN